MTLYPNSGPMPSATNNKESTDKKKETTSSFPNEAPSMLHFGSLSLESEPELDPAPLPSSSSSSSQKSYKSRSKSRSKSPSHSTNTNLHVSPQINAPLTSTISDTLPPISNLPLPSTELLLPQPISPITSTAPTTTSSSSSSSKSSTPQTGLYEQFSSSEIEVRLANPREDPNSPLYSVTRFEDLNLSPELLRGLYAMNFTRPSKIQEKALPLLLADPPTNLIAQSQSGTGKTAAFALTMLKRSDPSITAVQAVCIVNTREVAKQIAEVLQQMSVHTELKVGLAVKEETPMKLRPKFDDHILVGTPGTLLDLARRRHVDLSSVKVLVFDEADAMLDAQNLMVQAQQVRKLINRHAQILLFSATFPEKVKSFAESFAPNANMLILRREEVKVEAIKQFCIRVSSHHEKCAKLSDLYGLLTVGQSIIFVKTRMSAYSVAKFMQSEGHKVSVLTGQDTPTQRDAVMNEFREGKSKVLISTDVLSRGIDVPQINLVINYDMPVDEFGRPDYETYVHRIGRTGRFGRSGVSINFIDGEKAEKMQHDITGSYGMNVVEMPSDLEVMEKMLKQFRFA